MNEKIKELAIISACKNQPLFDSIVRGEYSASSYNKAIEELMEHFAELIVRECIQVCKIRIANHDYNTGRMHCASDIKDHFGLK